MIELIVILALSLSCVATVINWRNGVWLCISVGFMQDPVRKLIPGEPIYMVALCAGVFVAILAGLWLNQYRFRLGSVPGWQGGVRRALLILLAVILLQLVLGFLNTHSLFIVGMGVLTYMTPILAILAGFYFACRVGESGLVNLMLYYSVLCIVFTSGIYLEYLGVDWKVLGEVGSGLLIYDVGTVLKGYSGFFRSSEIAAWHIVLGSSFLLVLATRSRLNRVRILCVVGIVFLIGAGILTGRRKLIVSAVLFLTCYWFLLTVYYRRSLRVAVVVAFIGLTTAWIAVQEYYVSETGDGVYDLYVERASGVFGDITERGRLLGLGSAVTAVRKHGLLGLGAGTAGQGARLDRSSARFGTLYEAEGGLGRIVVELGLIGLLALLWLIGVFSVYLWRVMQYVSVKGGSYGYICYGMIGVLVANLAHFTVASQVFSDPLILILLGLITGIIASGPVLVNRVMLAVERGQ